MGPETVAPYIDDICNLLNDPEGCVIRATLDTLCVLGTFSTETVRLLHGFLARAIPNWKDDDTRKLMLEQIRYLSSLALLAWVTNAGRTSAEVEAALIETLKDDNEEASIDDSSKDTTTTNNNSNNILWFCWCVGKVKVG